jgi:hypothetical protein
MQSPYRLLLIFVLFSCSPESQVLPDDPVVVDLAGVVDSAEAEAGHDSIPLSEDESCSGVKEIGRKRLHPGKVKVPQPFDAYTALLHLFPGTACTDTNYFGSDTFQLVWWICEECEQISYQYAYWADDLEDEKSTFPDTSWNTTVVLGEETILIDSTEYIAMIFYHTTMTVPEFSGRFSGAPTGIALFRKRETDYVLENFTAVAGEYGNYSQPDYPNFMIAGKNNLLVDFTVENGGAGSDYVSVKELFVPYNGTFKKVLREEFLSCGNTHRGEWESELRVLDSNSSVGHSDLRIVTSGEFNGSGFEVGSDDYTWVFDKAPKEFLKVANAAIRDQSAFSFVLTRTYVFEDGRYRLNEVDMKFKKIRWNKWIWGPPRQGYAKKA